MQPQWWVALVSAMSALADRFKVRRETEAYLAEAAGKTVTTMSDVMDRLHAELKDRERQLDRLRAELQALELKRRRDQVELAQMRRDQVELAQMRRLLAIAGLTSQLDRDLMTDPSRVDQDRQLPRPSKVKRQRKPRHR